MEPSNKDLAAAGPLGSDEAGTGARLNTGTSLPETTMRARRAKSAQMRSIKRTGQPDDVLGACVFLASPESDFITGQTIIVDGGGVMH